ncbi:MAG: FtsQ-type POTRA domain-containing protein [Leptolyngbyaceae cyanobacterium RM1_1_2]|nr:FtsQ-type POTRA domain-containing protein [Leptolyngbyaceae cyanobacterium RM1_1_2]
MTDEALTTVSPTALAARRQQLRRQRQVRIVQALWRNAALLGLTAGMVWATALPKWLVYTPEQIEIQGNKILSEAAIRESLDIDYPQSLLVLQPSAIATQLEANAPIAEAAVTRRLFPPGLIVQVQERKPVAIALPDTVVADDLSAGDPRHQAGLLDASGNWMPQSSFNAFSEVSALPQLKVRGMQVQYQADWPNLYRAISQSSIKIYEIDWRQPSNLILQTELGSVHVGAYSDRLPAQLATLRQLRHLDQRLAAQEIAYIDLSSPQKPVIQMLQAQQVPQ